MRGAGVYLDVARDSGGCSSTVATGQRAEALGALGRIGNCSSA